MKTITSHSLEETQKIAADWLADISAHEKDDEAAVFGLSGHLGAAKTTFVQSVAKALGIEDTVTSPTFVLMKMYDTKNDRFHRLVHIDAYRLESGTELEALDFEKIVSDPHNLVLIEWAENVKAGLPEDIQWIKFEATGENERKITLHMSDICSPKITL